MKAEDLLIGKVYKNLHREGDRVIYRGVIIGDLYKGEHNFDSIFIPQSGLVCTNEELNGYIGEIK